MMALRWEVGDRKVDEKRVEVSPWFDLAIGTRKEYFSCMVTIGWDGLK